MTNHYIDEYADEFGPEKIVHIYEPKSKLKAIVVIDNLSLGPALGGCRMASDVTTREVFRLARAMTFKNALNSIPHGGGKSAIIADSKTEDKESLMRAFAQAIKDLRDYIPGPDMGTNETCMAYIQDEIKRSVGLPKVIGGIPLDELGMTGYGLAVAADAASEILNLKLSDARVVIQGYGNVGKAAARFLAERGAKIIATCNSKGAIHNAAGLDLQSLNSFLEKNHSVQDTGLGEIISNEALLEVESDIFIPAARPDIFNSSNQHLLKTRLVLEGANIPITLDAAKTIHDRGIIVVPDVIANSGGVICAATEYQRMAEAQAFERIKASITRNTKEVLRRTLDEKQYPHDAAKEMARERLTQAMSFRAHM